MNQNVLSLAVQNAAVDYSVAARHDSSVYIKAAWVQLRYVFLREMVMQSLYDTCVQDQLSNLRKDPEQFDVRLDALIQHTLGVNPPDVG